MSQLAEFFWIYIAFSFAIGLLTGFLTWKRQEGKKWWRGWLLWGLIIFAIGAVAAGLKFLPGRNGLYLELALLFFVAFIVGCWLGGLVRGLFSLPEGKGVATEKQSSPAVPNAPSPAVNADTVVPKPVPLAGVAAMNGPVPNSRDDAIEGQAAAKTETDAPVPEAVAAVPLAGVAGQAGNTIVNSVNQPIGLAGAREGAADDLKKIKGIGKKNETILNQLGIYHFDQIAAWSEENVAWVDDYLRFHGRIAREGWIGQAKKLVADVETEFAKRVPRAEVESSRKK